MKKTCRMKKGEIWIADIPSLGGREQEGTRPIIILSGAIDSLPTIIPCTANVYALRFPYTLEINPSPRNGLKNFSVALIFQIRVIDRRRLKQKIGTLEPQSLKLIDLMLKKLLGL